MEHVYIKDSILVIDWQILKASSNAKEDLKGAFKQAYLLRGDNAWPLEVTDVSLGKIRISITGDSSKKKGANFVNLEPGEYGIKLIWDKHWTLVSDGCTVVEVTKMPNGQIYRTLRRPHEPNTPHPYVEDAPMERGVAMVQHDSAFYIDGEKSACTSNEISFTDRVATFGYDGMNAYELAVRLGYDGSLKEWLDRLGGGGAGMTDEERLQLEQNTECIKYLQGSVDNVYTKTEVDALLQSYAPTEAPDTLRMDITYDGDSLISLGETKHVEVRILDGAGKNRTKDVIDWRIERFGGTSADSDTVWNSKKKAKDFNNQINVDVAKIDLTWSKYASENDFDPDVSSVSTKWRVTATIGSIDIYGIIEQ